MLKDSSQQSRNNEVDESSRREFDEDGSLLKSLEKRLSSPRNHRKIESASNEKAVVGGFPENLPPPALDFSNYSKHDDG